MGFFFFKFDRKAWLTFLNIAFSLCLFVLFFTLFLFLFIFLYCTIDVEVANKCRAFHWGNEEKERYLEKSTKWNQIFDRKIHLILLLMLQKARVSGGKVYRWINWRSRSDWFRRSAQENNFDPLMALSYKI